MDKDVEHIACEDCERWPCVCGVSEADIQRCPHCLRIWCTGCDVNRNQDDQDELDRYDAEDEGDHGCEFYG